MYRDECCNASTIDFDCFRFSSSYVSANASILSLLVFLCLGSLYIHAEFFFLFGFISVALNPLFSTFVGNFSTLTCISPTISIGVLFIFIFSLSIG